MQFIARKHYIWLFALIALFTVASCRSDDAVPAEEEALTPVSFDATAVETEEQENANTRAGAIGYIGNVDRLKESAYGFGVFAYYTDSRVWATAASSLAPNFMYDQQVEWAYINTEGKTAWNYSPVKYWPNGTDENNAPGDPGNTATEADRQYLSFFAYTPYVGPTVTLDSKEYYFENTTGRYDDGLASPAYYDEQPEASGILRKSGNTATGAPWIRYRLDHDGAAAKASDKQVDIMWATRQDCYKNMDAGYGFMSGKVPFLFKHALARIDVYVQRVYDELEPGTPVKGPDPDQDSTKIFVSNFSLTPTALYHEGTLHLNDGTWTDLAETHATVFNYGTNEIRENLRGTLSSNEAVIQDVELDKWTNLWKENADYSLSKDMAAGTVNAGVNGIPQQLNYESRTYYVIPQPTVTLTPKISYSFVTRDDNLEIGYMEDSGLGYTKNAGGTYVRDNTVHRYSRIVHENITGTPITLTDLKGGRRYILLARIGVETVQFIVVSVEDWDFPLRFSTNVTDWVTQEITKTVDEE